MAEQRRRWFQLSLTTCVLMMVVAGVLVWANLRPYRLPAPYSYWDDGVNFGWPVTALYEDLGNERDFKKFWQSGAIIANSICALAILALTAFLSEYITRRRSRSKQEAAA